MTRDLPQAQERFQHLDLGLVDPLCRDPRQQRLAIMLAQLVVKGALILIQLAEDRLLHLFRQIASHLLLRSPEDKWLQRPRQQQSAVIIQRAAGAVHIKRARCPEHPGIQKFEQAPKLAEMILHRRAG